MIIKIIRAKSSHHYYGHDKIYRYLYRNTYIESQSKMHEVKNSTVFKIQQIYYSFDVSSRIVVLIVKKTLEKKVKLYKYIRNCKPNIYQDGPNQLLFCSILTIIFILDNWHTDILTYLFLLFVGLYFVHEINSNN